MRNIITAFAVLLFSSGVVLAQTFTGRGTIGDSGVVSRMDVKLDELGILVDAKINMLEQKINKIEECNRNLKFFDSATSSCVEENDPKVKEFAKSDLPQCNLGEFLTGANGVLYCAKPPAFELNKPYSVSCTSQAGRTQTVAGTGAGEVLIARAPSNQGTWVIFPEGPYLNCFDGAGPPPDFTNEPACRDYAGLPGHGRMLSSCVWQ